MEALGAAGVCIADWVDHLIATNCQLTFVLALFAIAN